MNYTFDRFFCRNRTLYKGGLFSLFSFINSGIGFVLVLILARFIAPSEYGRLSIFNTVVTFIGPLLGLSSAGYLSISYFQKNRDDFVKDFTAVLNIHILTALCLIIVTLLLGITLCTLLDLPLYTLYFAIFSVFCQAIFSIYLNYLRLNERIIYYGIYSCGFAFLNFVLSLGLIILFKQGWLGRIHAQTICSLIFAIVVLYLFVKHDFFRFDKTTKRYKTIIFWSLPLIPNMAIIWLTNGVDQYIIKYHYSLYEVGIFSFAINLNSIITIIGNAFNQTNSVTLFKILSDKSLSDKIQILKEQEKKFVMIFLLATFSVVVISSFMVFFAMPKYQESIPYFCILSVFGFLQCIYWLYCNYYFYFKMNRQLMYILISSAVLHVVLSLILTKYSLYLTAFVFCLCQSIAVYLVVHGAMKMRNQFLMT